jgi:hypothetical protein
MGTANDACLETLTISLQAAALLAVAAVDVRELLQNNVIPAHARQLVTAPLRR